MGFKQIKSKPWFRIVSNKYLLILLCFLVWMLFLDSNSWLVHRELNEEIDKLKDNKAYYHKEIDHDKSIIDQLRDPDGLERYAREKYFMKRNDEDVYIIEYQDSIDDTAVGY